MTRFESLRETCFTAVLCAPIHLRFQPSSEHSDEFSGQIQLLHHLKTTAESSTPILGKNSGSSPHCYFGNPAFGIGLSYPVSTLANPMIPNSPGGPGSHMRHDEFNMRLAGGMRNVIGGIMNPWHLENMDVRAVLSLLEEFKSNKAKCFELSEIVGHVVEFSADQYGSRFIQQKLETSITGEKKWFSRKFS